MVRCWDGADPRRSYVVCGPPHASAPPHRTGSAGPAAAGSAAGPPGPHASEDAQMASGGSPAGALANVVDVPRYSYGTRSVHGVPVVEETIALERSAAGEGQGGERDAHAAKRSWAERAAALSHRQTVTDLLHVDVGGPVLLSCSMDGVVKAWR
jgi:hypothetical protein